MITVADVKLGQGRWTDLNELEREGNLILVDEYSVGALQIITVDGATVNGNPVLYLRANMHDGRVIVHELSAALIATLGGALRGRYGL